jgi:predicted Zn-dependent protease
VSYYRQALRIDPSVTSYHFILANYLRAGGRPQEALRAADDGLRVHPNHFSVRRARAIALIALGRVDEAERELRTAMVDSAPRLDDEINLASINLKRGHLETAANGFRKAEVAGGHGWGTLIARHYIEAGLPGPALVHLEEAFRSEPACAQWLLTTQSPYWAIVRGDPQARALIETYTAQ